MPMVPNSPVPMPRGRPAFGGGKSSVILTTNQWPDRTSGPFEFDDDADEQPGYPESDADDIEPVSDQDEDD